MHNVDPYLHPHFVQWLISTRKESCPPGCIRNLLPRLRAPVCRPPWIPRCPEVYLLPGRIALTLVKAMLSKGGLGKVPSWGSVSLYYPYYSWQIPHVPSSPESMLTKFLDGSTLYPELSRDKLASNFFSMYTPYFTRLGFISPRGRIWEMNNRWPDHFRMWCKTTSTLVSKDSLGSFPWWCLDFGARQLIYLIPPTGNLLWCLHWLYRHPVSSIVWDASTSLSTDICSSDTNHTPPCWSHPFPKLLDVV